MIVVTWYAAAHYCNWLSEQEGLPRTSGATSPTRPGLTPRG